ncbi:hypothetical protein Z517_06048 [Fonsecaea pedrosoi CBS 271.37]|uniref:Peptidase S1 domain-containing protein n=1 Tax=Fonsecaea pedrosoi CBS 271.37 TaxID=1442368 RepID=A0A0D2DNW1_9EURO|nr:uncharacterized protein Z517_06048 [Fonsecaea pedrosoi CBS 271.37]KIW79436.1 hypothetical protein Z517_06048 [Fonsecaea pedrosoi CBS 271.37]
MDNCGTGSFVWVTPLRERKVAAQYNMEGSFGGPIYSPLHNTWKRPLQVEDSGDVVLEGKSAISQVSHLGSNINQVNKALGNIGSVSMAAGKLYVTVWLGETATFSEVFMSGFWLDGDKFLTCAHLLDTIEGTNISRTLKLLQDPTLTTRAAFVNVSRVSRDHDYTVYLIHHDRASDLAVFRLKPDAGKEKGQPPHSVDLTSLVSIYAGEPFNESNPPSSEATLYPELFAAYYPGMQCTVTEAHLNQDRKAGAQAANVEDAWDWMSRETISRAKENGKHCVTKSIKYAETFAANTRSVAFGRIITCASSPVLIQEPSSMTHLKNCDIVGYWGCSGGMVCQYQTAANGFEPKVVGLFHGEDTDNSCNNILVFTPGGVNELQKLLRSHA